MPRASHVIDPEQLLDIIREKILRGDLPKEHCRMTWYHPGTGGRCAACEQPVVAPEVEVECDLPGGGTMRFHVRCYQIWSEEGPR
jgi:hypothetical protein